MGGRVILAPAGPAERRAMRRTRTLTSAIRGGTSPFEIGAGIGRGAPRFPTSCGRQQASWRTRPGVNRIGYRSAGRRCAGLWQGRVSSAEREWQMGLTYQKAEIAALQLLDESTRDQDSVSNQLCGTPQLGHCSGPIDREPCRCQRGGYELPRVFSRDSSTTGVVGPYRRLNAQWSRKLNDWLDSTVRL